MQIKAKLQYFLEKKYLSLHLLIHTVTGNTQNKKFNIHFSRVHKIEKGALRSSGRTISAMKDDSREYD